MRLGDLYNYVRAQGGISAGSPLPVHLIFDYKEMAHELESIEKQLALAYLAYACDIPVDTRATNRFVVLKTYPAGNMILQVGSDICRVSDHRVLIRNLLQRKQVAIRRAKYLLTPVERHIQGFLYNAGLTRTTGWNEEDRVLLEQKVAELEGFSQSSLSVEPEPGEVKSETEEVDS
ncbi:MAG TPA: hypothetical protein PLT51_00405 [Candidatus Dojkabacteria bacterium]|nr:hypothetical protein [Candidatus Dojkabacteria bacterium]